MYVNGPKIVTDGLVLLLDAGNRKSYPGSGTTWIELTGNGYVGTLTNGPTFNSGNGGSIVFDGVNDHVTFSTYSQPAYSTTTSFTWNVWVYPTVNSDPPLVGNRGTDLDFTKLTSNNMEYYPTNFGGKMDLNVWQNVCVVKDQTNLFYYKNGSVLVSTTSSTTKPSKSFYIGGDPTANEYGTARIAIVGIYNRALTATEILQNYNATRSRFGV